MAAGSGGQAHHAAVPAPPRQPNGQVRYVVQRYDSPWSIAERHLGEGTRWRDILDADGRRLVESSTGRTRFHGSSARILHPGEVLLLPGIDHQAGSLSTVGRTHVDPPPAPRPPGALAEPAPRAGSALTRQAAAQAPRASPVPTARGTAAAPLAVRSHPITSAPPAVTARAPAPAAPIAPPAAPAAPAAPATAASAPAPASAPTPPAAPASAPIPPTPAAPTIEAVQPGPGEIAPSLSPPTVMQVMSRRRSTNPAPALLEAGLVGAAVVAVVGTLRQRQAQRRPAGKLIRLPGRELAQCERILRSGQTPDRAILVTQATEFLAETLVRTGVTPPTVLGVVVDDDCLEILLDRPAPPPAPWTPSSEGFRWRIAAGDVGPSLSVGSAPLPALTSVGRAATGSADVLINLEAAGMVGITGRTSQAAGLLDAMATHLAGAPWAGAVDLVLVGLAPALAVLDRVRTAPSIASLRDELRATASVMTETMAGHRCRDPFQGRVAGVAGDGWPPVLVFCAQRPSADDLTWLREVARPGSGVAAVIAGPADVARWAIDVDVRPMPVDPLRLGVEPNILSRDDMDDIGALLELAQDDVGADLADPPYDRIRLSVESACPIAVPDENLVGTAASLPRLDLEPASDLTEHEPTLRQRLARLNPPALGPPDLDRAEPIPSLPDGDVVVRILGSVEVDGPREFKRAKARELVVYLAMHPNGVGEAELDEALWPSSTGRVVSPATRDSTVSAARSAIGGPARLLPAQGQGREKRYQLSPAIQSDWSRFCILHRWGREHASAAALRQALEHVRGRPFEGVVSGRTYGWIHMEGHAHHIEAEVADAADLAAGLCLDDGDAIGARWAARRGLLADPYTERLWVRLMDAAHLLGESQEVERIMDEMDVVLELGGDFSGLHPNTLAAYDRLSRRHRLPR